MSQSNTGRPGAGASPGLHECPECESKLVQPIHWKEEGSRTRWRVWRRCPECEWRFNSVHDEAEIEAFDLSLDDGCHVLKHWLNTLERNAMEEMETPFVLALQTDLITAEDFRLAHR